ncbi:MAG: peptidase M10 [Sphingobacteriales bacterium]|nr:MAG: peptidase M10 [Sphingobacteriales bacterium]
MGEVELTGTSMIIRSVLVFYGDAATAELSAKLAADVARLWNEPETEVIVNHQSYRLQFDITGVYDPDLEPETVWFNDDPALNFFRIETYASGNISFVDGIGSNTGYLKLQNLEQTATTIAHEYGHTIGLEHPDIMDVRGRGIPGIMFPRGTLCDAAMQYDPLAKAGEYGGVMDPQHRRVLDSDIAGLKLHKLSFDDWGKATLGEFTSVYHQKHENTEATETS